MKKSIKEGLRYLNDKAPPLAPAGQSSEALPQDRRECHRGTLAIQPAASKGLLK